MRPYVPGGQTMARSVATRARPDGGIVISTALDRSSPAASSDPALGMVALSLRSLIRSGARW